MATERKRIPIRDALGLTEYETEAVNDLLSAIDPDKVVKSTKELVESLDERDRIHIVAGIVIARAGFVVSLDGN